MPSNSTQINDHPILAALDIGSNSFHLVIARHVNGDIQLIKRSKEQVRMAAGLDDKNHLSEEAIKRGLDCLEQLSEELKGIDAQHIHAVATHTLRVARNAETFIERAKSHFPAPIEVISGVDEARLIYQGVTHISNIHSRALVMDIGGGSTEFVIGEEFIEKEIRSCPVGCVNLSKRYFEGGEISSSRFNKLVSHVEDEVCGFRDEYLRSGWKACLGSSGSIRTVDRILKEAGHQKRAITLDHLFALREEILKSDRLDQIKLAGVDETRTEILPAAVGILIAAFKCLDIEHMEYSRGALREGLLYEMR